MFDVLRPARPITPRRALLALGGCLVLVLGAIMGWLKWHEADLIFVTAASHARPLAPLPDNGERVTIMTASGAPLAAVLLRTAPQADSGYWVLHLHGNAETAFSVSQFAHAAALVQRHLNVLGFDYRGFGATPGEVSEQHVYEDAEAAYQFLLARGVTDQRIIIWGHSLGSGPAVYLATRHPAAALVTFGAFTSIPDMAAVTYPWLPVRALVGVQFNSLQRMPAVHIPVLIAHSVADLTVPYAHAAQLLAAANEPKRFLRLDYPSQDGFGGHVDALYEHLDELLPLLSKLTGATF